MAKETRIYTIRGGTERSWEREVGYGSPPESYLKDIVVRVDVETNDTEEIARERARNFRRDLWRDR